MTQERMVLAFQALDELVPNLGVYAKIFRKLREDFFEAVYSDELTGTASASKTGDHSYIQRLPYFYLVQQVYTERHEFSEELKDQLEIVKKRLFDKHKQLEETQESLADKDDHISVLNTTKDELQSVIDDKDRQIEDLENELEQTQDDARNKEHQFDCDLIDLKDVLEEAKNEINYLSQFKKGYDDLYFAFMEKNDASAEVVPKKKKKTMISTKRANLLSGVESAQKLEDQLLSVMNTAIEEYDKYIETHKSELIGKEFNEEMTEAELDLQDLEMSDADQELETVQFRFQGTMSNLMTELELLKQHSSMLMEQLQILEEIKPTAPKKKETKGKSESLLMSGLDIEEESEETSDPFIPQERVFSKYAAMLYTSNNSGKTFEEFKDAKYCASCGEKTVICPHKLGGSDKVFMLPHNCSHIKIIRPKVKINKEFADDVLKAPSPDPTLDFAPSVSSPGRSYVSGQITDMPVTPGTVTSVDSPSMGAGEMYMGPSEVHTMQRLWDDYRERTSIERTIPRNLDPERSKSLMEQFLAYLVWTDDFTSDEEANLSVLDTLYCFMHDRYLVEDVVYMATHDFLSAVTEYSGMDKGPPEMLQLVGHVLVGNLDAVCLRYVLLMCDFISAVNWKEVEDFRAFMSVVYPFLNEDDLESLQMSYTSYSENRISKQRVSSFIIHIILKYREPRFHDLENKLVAFQNSEGGQLNEREFKDALESLLPLSNERTRRRLYMQAEKAVRWDGIVGAVPIMRLAQISGFLALQQITTFVRENVAVRVNEWRDRPSSAGSDGIDLLTDLSDFIKPIKLKDENEEKKDAPKQGDTTHDIIDFDKVLSLSDVKNMAHNMNRQAKNREERKDSSSQDDDEEDW